MGRLKSHHNVSAEEYEQLRRGHLERRRHQLVQDALLLQRGNTHQVLEIGFGSGKLLATLALQFPDLQFHGTEVEAKMVQYAQARYRLPNLRYMHCDISVTSLQERYGFIYSIDVVHHVPNHRQFFQMTRQLLHPGGRWLAIEPNIFHPYIYIQQERMRRAGLGEDHFRPWVLEPLLRAAGFTIEKRRFVFLFPGWVERLPGTLTWIERTFERSRLLGGSVVYLLSVP